jgi:hypothetical protein
MSPAAIWTRLFASVVALACGAGAWVLVIHLLRQAL